MKETCSDGGELVVPFGASWLAAGGPCPLSGPKSELHPNVSLEAGSNFRTQLRTSSILSISLVI